ncbi:MAG TPA: putative Ig domain-containing protein [Gallionella sp.]|nr:putative Ig domain-containing protein [Gallionella sp.]
MGNKQSGQSDDAALATIKTKEGISITLVREPSAQVTGVITVSLPKETATSGSGFSFPLPAQIAARASNVAVRVTTMSGGPLPRWLRYDAKTKTFIASSVPDGSFPMQLMITVGTQQTTLVISERAEN